MKTKYDIITEEIKIDDVKMFNEEGNGTHIASVYEYVKFAINNEEGFLAFLFDDCYIEREDNLNEEQQEELDDFMKFCNNADNQKPKVNTENGKDIDVFECRCDLLSYEY